MIEATGKVASEVVSGLKQQPLALAMIVINLLFLLVLVFVLYAVREAGERRDKQMSSLIETCQQK